jgi:hypothetical protein
MNWRSNSVSLETSVTDRVLASNFPDRLRGIHRNPDRTSQTTANIEVRENNETQNVRRASYDFPNVSFAHKQKRHNFHSLADGVKVNAVEHATVKQFIEHSMS